MTYRYRVYYEFNGSTKADPLRKKKTDGQISDALEQVGFELSVYLDDEEATITISPESERAIRLTLETTQPEAVVSRAVEKCLAGLDLFGSKLP